MIRCGLSTPQQVTITGTGFVDGAKVLVTPPDSAVTLTVTPDFVSSTTIVFAFVFVVCGDYLIEVTDETGQCDTCASDPFTLTPTPLPCPSVDDVETLASLRAAVQHGLGDDPGAIWSADEVDTYLREAYKLLCTQLPIFWTQTYLENLPRGFSYTQPWEKAELTRFGGFDYGQANFTAEFERRALGDERRRVGPANHTSPFEATDGLLQRAGASTAIPATADLPKTLTALDRATWDNRQIEALEPRSYSRFDARYEITTGEVLGYMWQKDGVRTFRKVRVPVAQAETLVIGGSWGAMRQPPNAGIDESALVGDDGGPFDADDSGESLGGDETQADVTGSWGVPRRIPGHHPIGPELWGAPRRPFLEGRNVRVEHFRHGRALAQDTDVCELPPRYAIYLRDYAKHRCFSRPGPGYDAQLGDFYLQKWTRGVARVQRRLQLVDTEHVTVFGGDGRPSVGRPPRPRLPWQYGARVR